MGGGGSLECLDLVVIDLECDLEEAPAGIGMTEPPRGASTQECELEAFAVWRESLSALASAAPRRRRRAAGVAALLAAVLALAWLCWSVPGANPQVPALRAGFLGPLSVEQRAEHHGSGLLIRTSNYRAQDASWMSHLTLSEISTLKR